MVMHKEHSNGKKPGFRALSLVTLLTAMVSSTLFASAAKAADCLANAPVLADYIVAGTSGFLYAQSQNRACVVNVGDRITFRFDAVKPEGCSC
jgi:hypothetical protein